MFYVHDNGGFMSFQQDSNVYIEPSVIQYVLHGTLNSLKSWCNRCIFKWQVLFRIKGNLFSIIYDHVTWWNLTLKMILQLKWWNSKINYARKSHLNIWESLMLVLHVSKTGFGGFYFGNSLFDPVGSFWIEHSGCLVLCCWYLVFLEHDKWPVLIFNLFSTL